jgi:hypothetical protein
MEAGEMAPGIPRRRETDLMLDDFVNALDAVTQAGGEKVSKRVGDADGVKLQQRNAAE